MIDSKTYHLEMIYLLSLFMSLNAFGEVHLDQIKLPKGFEIEIYAKDIKNARSMAWGPNAFSDINRESR
jgi:hypothetical protein